MRNYLSWPQTLTHAQIISDFSISEIYEQIIRYEHDRRINTKLSSVFTEDEVQYFFLLFSQIANIICGLPHKGTTFLQGLLHPPTFYKGGCSAVSCLDLRFHYEAKFKEQNIVCFICTLDVPTSKSLEVVSVVDYPDCPYDLAQPDSQWVAHRKSVRDLVRSVPLGAGSLDKNVIQWER